MFDYIQINGKFSMKKEYVLQVLIRDHTQCQCCTEYFFAPLAQDPNSDRYLQMVEDHEKLTPEKKCYRQVLNATFTKWFHNVEIFLVPSRFKNLKTQYISAQIVSQTVDYFLEPDKDFLLEKAKTTPKSRYCSPMQTMLELMQFTFAKILNYPFNKQFATETREESHHQQQYIIKTHLFLLKSYCMIITNSFSELPISLNIIHDFICLAHDIYSQYQLKQTEHNDILAKILTIYTKDLQELDYPAVKMLIPYQVSQISHIPSYFFNAQQYINQMQVITDIMEINSKDDSYINKVQQ